jgi:hypothetical protein
MADKGIKSKRRWAQWLSYIGAFITGAAGVAVAVAPQAAAAYPQYSVPIGLAAVALPAIAGQLAKKSKDKDK